QDPRGPGENRQGRHHDRLRKRPPAKNRRRGAPNGAGAPDRKGAPPRLERGQKSAKRRLGAPLPLLWGRKKGSKGGPAPSFTGRRSVGGSAGLFEMVKMELR